jgi:hypothetical protein
VPNGHGAFYQLEHVHIGIYSRGPKWCGLMSDARAELS